jgi:hypothetical protein
MAFPQLEIAHSLLLFETTTLSRQAHDLTRMLQLALPKLHKEGNRRWDTGETIK